MRFFLILLSASLMSCASHEASRPPSEQPPFLRRYMKKEKEMIYLVVEMSPNVDSKTKEMIDYSMKRFDPEVIVTSFRPEETFELQRQITECEQGKTCNPAMWTCYRARPRGIPCLTAEPYHSDILKDLQRKNVKPVEVLFFYTFVSLVKLAKKGKNPLPGLEEKIEENRIRLNTVIPFTRDDFIRMYKEKMNSSVIRPIHEDYQPDQSGNYLQKLSYAIEQSKHSLIYKRMNSEFRTHQRVMIIFNPYYFEMHRPQIEDSFGSYVP